MKEKQLISSGAPWEETVGYSRAVKVGPLVEVSGTTAVQDGEVVFLNDAYGQTRFIFQRIAETLEKAGCSMNDVIRTRMFVTDISKWEEFGKAHGEFFSEVKPCATMVEVNQLIRKEMLVEIEVTAWKEGG